jgi:hypothetical protein
MEKKIRYEKKDNISYNSNYCNVARTNPIIPYCEYRKKTEHATGQSESGCNQQKNAVYSSYPAYIHAGSKSAVPPNQVDDAAKYQ